LQIAQGSEASHNLFDECLKDCLISRLLSGNVNPFCCGGCFLLASLFTPVLHVAVLQCGFCTPGFVMSMVALLRSKAPAAPTEEEIEENLAGNLWWVPAWQRSRAREGLRLRGQVVRAACSRQATVLSACGLLVLCLLAWLCVSVQQLRTPAPSLPTPRLQPLHRLSPHPGRLQGLC
jgi:hypothetical protein